jgi:16S rRNA (adenine1518-N6/adenine1519-N6)-dimethyltransferase
MPTLYEEVRALLRDTEFRPRKSRGQNFLIHEHVIEAILRLLDLQPSDGVVEIGRACFMQLVDRAQAVWAVEVDDLWRNGCARANSGQAQFQLIYGDVLKVALPELLPNGKLKLVGNLPYNISTEVLFRIFDWRKHFSSLVLMLQKEVADRIASGPGAKSYGTLSVWCQVHGRIGEKIHVAPEAFYPRPKVRSTILKIELLPQARVCQENLPALKGLVRAAFGQRRKTLSNAVGSWLMCERDVVDRLLAAHDVDPKRRGETLSVDEFVKLAQAIRVRGLLPTSV